MFFGSGAASLILQVVWFKQLQFVLGSSTSAVSITIASFFLGLSLGARFGGRLADRTRRPLRSYGVVEATVGVLALLVTLFLSAWASWIDPLLPAMAMDSIWRTPVTILVGAGTLLGPTMLMGATLPFLARFVVHSRDVIASRIGLLYGINTLGAACGCLLVGFVLIELLGVTASAATASGIYFAVAATAFWLARSETPTEPAAATDPEPAEPEQKHGELLVWVFAASGLVSIAYEVIWFRMLGIVSARSVYAFASMLAVYLAGLVAGSFICARFLAPRKDKLLASFARVQVLIGASAILSLAVLGKVTTLRHAINVAVAATLPLSLQGMFADTLRLNLLCLAVFAVPTTLIGIGFPLASELTIHRIGIVGSRLGRLYSLNTLGGVMGSLLAGFVFLPMLGSQWSLVLMVAVNIGLAFAVVFSTELRTTLLRREVVVSGIAVVMIVAILGPNYLDAQLTAYKGGKVLELRESKDATYVVLEYDGDGDRYVQLLANGTSYANNSPPGRRYMAALAHLPVLMHPDPHSAVVICIGTGTTVGALTTYDALEDISAVDLSREVFGFAKHFVPVNESFHTNPRVHQIAADGRHYLMSHDGTFDVLTFEPPPPDDAGVVNLYSEEFYEIARQRMTPNSVIAQWVPMTMVRGDLSKVLLRAMLNEFPHVSLWVTNRMEGIAVASDQPLRIDEAELRRRMAEPRVHASLAAVGLETPEDLLGTFFAADDALEAWVADTPTVTDDRPRIEYHRYFDYRMITPAEIAAIREDVGKYMTAPPTHPQQLQAAREAVVASNSVYAAKDPAEKRRFAAQALSLRPDNAYYRWQVEATR